MKKDFFKFFGHEFDLALFHRLHRHFRQWFHFDKPLGQNQRFNHAIALIANADRVLIRLFFNYQSLRPQILHYLGARFFNFNGQSSIYGGNCIITIPSLEQDIRKFLAG